MVKISDPVPKNVDLQRHADSLGVSPEKFYYDTLNATLDAVTDAIVHQLLAPARLVRREPCAAPLSENGVRTLFRCFEVADLPCGTFRIVDGMSSGFSHLWTPLHAYRIAAPGRPPLHLRGAYPAGVAQLPFAWAQDPARTAQPIQESHNRFLAGLATWERLLCGSLRLTDDPQCWSNIGARETQWLSPQRLQWDAEVVMSHKACFDLLRNMLLGWHGVQPIRAVEIK